MQDLKWTVMIAGSLIFVLDTIVFTYLLKFDEWFLLVRGCFE